MRKLTFIAAAVSVALLGGCQQMQEQPSSAPSVQSQPVQSEIDKVFVVHPDHRHQRALEGYWHRLKVVEQGQCLRQCT